MGLVGHSCRVLPSPTHIQEYLMDKLTNITQHSQPTMSSREIATLCDKRHDNVMADIRKMLNELGLYAPDFSGTYTTEQGNQYECFNLPKRECLILVSGYNLKLRTKIIDRWQELEQATTPRLPQTYLEALRALADEVEAHERTQQQLTIAEPKVQYFDKLVERNLLTNFTTTAKEFGIKRKDFVAYLLDNGYIYRDQRGNLLPYAVHVPHLFEVKEYCKDHHSGTQTLITPKGRETLRLLLS